MIKESINHYIDEHQEELISLIQDIITIRSVKDTSLPNYPFGLGIGTCLDKVMQYASDLGFKTVNLDGYVAYAEYGEGQEYIGIVGHLDVVSEGNGWTYPAYGAEIHEGILYGRGVLDNKSPILSCLFAMKTLMDLGCKLSYKVRIIFGTDEESGFNDIPYYLKKELPPLMGFTPDCKYPVVYGENGVFRASISQMLSNHSALILKGIQGEFASSFVPDFCGLIFHVNDNTIDIADLLHEYTGDWFLEDNQLILSCEGKKAPANNPYLGDNAIINMLLSLPSKFLEKTNIKEFTSIVNNYCSDIYAKNLGIGFHDEQFGDLMMTVYNLYLDNNQLILCFTVRYPINCLIESRLEQCRTIFQSFNFILMVYMPAIHFSLDHPMIKVLSDAYYDMTGLDSTPTTTTGGTYAKIMPNIVAFGPSFPGERGIAHNKDEYMSVNHIILNTKIYAYSIYKLANINKEEL